MFVVRSFLDWWESFCSKEDDTEEYSTENSGLTAEQIQLARFMLKALGLERRSNTLEVEDLVFLCYSVGLNPPEYAIEAKLASLKLSKRENYSFVHFLHLWRTLLDSQDEEEAILERAFNFFDKDGNGVISTAEFRLTMKQLGNLLSEEEIEQFLKLMDTDNDGVVSYGEFLRLLKSQRPAYMKLANGTSATYQPSTTSDNSDHAASQSTNNAEDETR